MTADESSWTPPLLCAVWAEGARVLGAEWADGTVTRVDLEEIIETYKVFKPLRTDPALFAQVQVGEYGAYIAWTDEMDLSRQTLWRLAKEQAAKPPALAARV